MAEEVIASTVIALLEKAIAAAADRIGLVPGFKDELIKMEGLVRDIQARVADAEGKKFQNPIVLRWLKDFKGAALEAEIVLDELHYEDLRREVHKFKRGPAAKLPQQLEDFSSLVTLRIWYFDSLERLPGWLAKLTSLRELELFDCRKLEHLPTDAIRSLTNLQELWIMQCPLLRETRR